MLSRSRGSELVSYQVNRLIVEVNRITHTVGGVGGGGETENRLQNFSHGLGKIYDLIIVEIAKVYSNQATRDFAAPLGRGVKSTGAWPGGGCQNMSIQQTVQSSQHTLTHRGWHQLAKVQRESDVAMVSSAKTIISV